MEAEEGRGSQGQKSWLHLEVVSDEGVALRQIGNLKEWTASAWGVTLSVPPVTEVSRTIDTIRQVGLSWNLQAFTLHCVSPGWRIGPSTLGALAELIGLKSLTLDGGILVAGLDWHVLTGLKSLTELHVRPFRGKGITDADLLQQTALPDYLAAVKPTQQRKCAPTSPLGLPALTGLRKLEFRGCADMLSDEGLMCLTSLTNLHTLCILPLGILVTAQGLSGLCSSLSRLENLVTGVEQSGQVDVLKGALPEAGGSVQSLGLAVGDPEPELPGLLSTCTLCLLSNLTSLRLPHLKAEDPAFMVALGALTSLTQLCLTVAAARPEATPPFVINLSTLSQLRQLQHLEVAVVGGRRVGLPISLKLLSCCALAWPRLSHLLLTCMTTPTPQVNAGAQAAAAPSSGSSQSRQGESTQGQGKQQAPHKPPPAQGPQLQPRVSVGSAVQSIGWFVQPECLDILDAFSNLSHLSLLAPYPEEPPPPSSSNTTGAAGAGGHSKSVKHVSNSARGLWWLWGGDGSENEEQPHARSWQSYVGPGGWWGPWPAWAGGRASSGRASGVGGGGVKDGGQRGGQGQQGDSITMLEGLPLVPLAMHRLPPKLQHLSVERAVLWHPDAPLPPQLQSTDGGLVVNHKAASNSGKGPMPCLNSLELAQCEVSDDLAKLIFASSPGLNLLELVEVRGMSVTSLKSLSELISLHHLSVHQRNTSKPTHCTSDSHADSNSSNSHNEGVNGVGSLLWRMLGYQSSSKSRVPEDSKAAPSEPKLRPRDLWPVVRELTGLRTLQWEVWDDSKESSQSPVCPNKQRTRVRVSESRHALANAGSALPQQHHQQQRQQQQQLQRRRYWQQQCQQHLQQLQAHHVVGLPNFASSPLLSPPSLVSQHGSAASGPAQQRRGTSSSGSQTTVPPNVPPSSQLSSADLAAAGAASEAACGGRQLKDKGASQVPPRQLPSHVALGSWASAESLAAVLQSLPDLQMAYIDLREVSGRPSEAGPARTATGSLVRSSSTPSHPPVASPASAATMQLRPLTPVPCQLSVSGSPPAVLQDVYTGRLCIAVDE